MSASEKVTAYIKKHSKWSKELQTLRKLFQQTEVTEEIKWGSPTYTLNGKLVAGMAAFKNHYAIWFHQGFFLKDSDHKLLNAQEGKTKAMRQWRFEKEEEIPEAIVLKYLRESIQNCLAGKEVKPQRKTGVSLPSILKEAFKNKQVLRQRRNYTLLRSVYSTYFREVFINTHLVYWALL